MAPQNRSGLPAERLARYDRLIAGLPGVQRKGAKLPYTSVNGHMFSFLAEGGTLALRLPGPDRTTFIERFGTGLHEAHGTVMQEYVTVPDDLFDDPATLAPWFEASFAYVSDLPPKATTRRRSASR
jgi:hypothetical protein